MIQSEHKRDEINQDAFEMLLLCKKQISKASEAFVNFDTDLAEEVLFTENKVNAVDIKLEKDCERFLALFNPVATDLRFILAVFKIKTDLERVGDHAFSISKYVTDLEKPIDPKLLEALNFSEFLSTLEKMLDHITTAYEDEDVKTARKVFKKDKVLDRIKADSFAILSKELKANPEIIEQALILYSVINKIERVGDLIKNMAEDIIFYLDAQMKKLKKKDK